MEIYTKGVSMHLPKNLVYVNANVGGEEVEIPLSECSWKDVLPNWWERTHAENEEDTEMKEERYYTEREIIELVEDAMMRYAREGDAGTQVAMSGHYIIRKLLEKGKDDGRK